jgi:hypothetical protein
LFLCVTDIKYVEADIQRARAQVCTFKFLAGLCTFVIGVVQVVFIILFAVAFCTYFVGLIHRPFYGSILEC